MFKAAATTPRCLVPNCGRAQWLRGLCRRCRADPVLARRHMRALLPRTGPKQPVPKSRRCRVPGCRRTRKNRALCPACAADPKLRKRYGLASKFDSCWDIDDLTQKEVDRIVAQQLRCLPDWWENDSRREQRASASRWATIERVLLRVRARTPTQRRRLGGVLRPA